jgi:hypothetical protein
MAETQSALSSKESPKTQGSSAAAWLVSGIEIQVTQ